MSKVREVGRDAAIYIAVWTALGVFAATQNVVSTMYAHQPVHWVGTYVTQLLNWYTCGIGTPLYLVLVRRYPLSGGRILRRLPLYVGAVAVCVVLKYVVWVPLENGIFHVGWRFLDEFIPSIFGVTVDQIYFVTLLYAIEYYRSSRRHAAAAAELENRLSLAQLEALRSQLHPHFLFNTLNSVSALMHQDVTAADAMLARLSDMLRMTLEADGRQEVTLRDEVAVLELYLDIMRIRFRERLAVEVDIADSLLDERVPSFLLQPLVENTLRHGMNESARRTTVHVTARAEGDTLALQILDDGRGLPSGGAPREGIGLGNTRRRLEALYGEFGGIKVGAREGGGTEVMVRIPRRVGMAR
jgi:two-component system, LytTR family, sensor kinase